jgi:hypothetical protein
MQKVQGVIFAQLSCTFLMKEGIDLREPHTVRLTIERSFLCFVLTGGSTQHAIRLHLSSLIYESAQVHEVPGCSPNSHRASKTPKQTEALL